MSPREDCGGLPPRRGDADRPQQTPRLNDRSAAGGLALLRASTLDAPRLLSSVPGFRRIRSTDPRRPRPVTVSLYGDEREARLEEGVGILVAGHGIIVGDTVRIAGRGQTVRELRRLVTGRRASTLILDASVLS